MTEHPASTSDPALIGDLVTRNLRRMGLASPAPVSCRVLAGGISGALTVCVALPDGDAVLKLMARDAPAHVQVRSRREAAFYAGLAESLPIQVARRLASIADEGGTALLLEAYRPVRKPSQWGAHAWRRAGQELARLHALHWGNADRLAAYPWLRQHADHTDAQEVEDARAAWQRLAGQERLREVLSAEQMDTIAALLACMDEIDGARKAIPLTLCHGDCHAGNLLQDDQGRFVWADWQEVGVGYGPDDLSFFLQRAGASADPFAGVAIDAYHVELQEQLGTRVPIEALRQCMEAGELRTRLLYWPMYLAQATGEELAAFTRQMLDTAVKLKLRATPC